MKAFFVGLLVLIAMALLSGIGILLFPVFVALTLVVRLFLMVALVILGIWLLGKFVIYIWESLKNK
ncbi:MAG: hypothetical protein JW734_07115 [Candidatus Omnitrophica bacterium]|nr:hypothetical protein [Candidatus Omnitrophota bacterium]